MATQVILVRAHEPQDVEAIIVEALRIADAQEREGRAWDAIFSKACELLGARFPVTQETQPFAWDGNLHNVRV